MAAWIDRGEDWLRRRKQRNRRGEGDPIEKAESVADEQGPALMGVEFPVLRCPACRSKHVKTRNTLGWQDGMRLRYHVCEDCGERFKSLEEE